MAPRETRRSARGGAPHSASTSKPSSNSPDATNSPHSPPPNSSSRTKRTKDDPDDQVSVHEEKTGLRSKRKPKAKQPATPEPQDEDPQPDEEDEGGVTRCVCGYTDEDLGFMVQCEECSVWQHGACMGYLTEADCPETYYCELCHPELHVNLVRHLRKPRQSHANDASSAAANPSAATSTSRSSRSHSPLHRARSPKRRNTMNSRDAAYDETAAAFRASLEDDPNAEFASPSNATDADADASSKRGGKRKRKSAGDTTIEAEPNPAKRKRSADTPESSKSELPPATGSRPPGSTQGSVAPPSDPKEAGKSEGSTTGSRRRKKDNLGDGKHPNQYTYRGGKATTTGKRTANQTAAHEHGTRRNANAPQRAAHSPSPIPTSWNVPDHLSHLADILPSPSPRGLEVRVGHGEETVMEKGVRVRWPGKRTTIGEMRRRVRGIMEFVVRAQVETIEREKRAVTLKTALAYTYPNGIPEEHPTQPSASMTNDQDMAITPTPSRPRSREPSPVTQRFSTTWSNGLDHASKLSPEPDTLPKDTAIQPGSSTNTTQLPLPTDSTHSAPSTADTTAQIHPHIDAPSSNEIQTGSSVHGLDIKTPVATSQLTTSHLLDEIIRDLIQFQERFGAGKDNKAFAQRDRERRSTRAMVGVGDREA